VNRSSLELLFCLASPLRLEALQRPESFHEGRMRMVVRRVPVRRRVSTRALDQNSERNAHPVDPDGRQILDVQRDERASESVAHVPHLGRTQPILQLARESVCFPLEAPRHAIERDTDDGFHRRQDHLRPTRSVHHADNQNGRPT
jgi:hypothetical protein